MPGPSNQDALDEILELSHVAGPTVRLEPLKRGLGVMGRVPMDAPGFGLGQPQEEKSDIFDPFPKGRHRDVDDVEPVIEILAKLIMADAFQEVAVGGGKDPRVDGNGAAVADAFETAVLEYMQQFGLQGDGQFPDLVQKNGAAVGELESPQPLVVGASESALGVSEKFAFEKRGGQGRAVGLDEEAIPAPAHLVNAARQVVLARSGLAGDEHGFVRFGRARDHLHDACHLRRGKIEIGRLIFLAALH